ncbi:MAG: hypothetical protein BWY82_02577 [Verrucomicrobia bacterium ADurb.Bin474]|nr:MAG: hypothetical protein BWY82_02577 [Verrucomicrobia bacterium ADurb.Bin474]
MVAINEGRRNHPLHEKLGIRIPVYSIVNQIARQTATEHVFKHIRCPRGTFHQTRYQFLNQLI